MEKFNLFFNYFDALDKDSTNRVKKKIYIANNLLKKHKTPFLIIQEKEILNSLELFKKYIPDVQIHYAIKSNADTYILDLIKSQGLSFDVASSGEIELLTKLGIKGNRMILANTVKTPNSIITAIKKRVKAYTFDNINELKKLLEFFKSTKTKFIPASLVRIKTYSKNVQTDLSEKFGCDKDEAIELIEFAYKNGLNPVGIAFHVGTQSFDIENYEKSFEDTLFIIDKVKTLYNIDLKIIDIGGGFPIDTIYGTGSANLHDFFSKFQNLIEKYKLNKFILWAEPGRIISGPAGTLVTTIIGKSKRGNKHWLFLDDGVYGCYSGVIYDHALFNYIPLNPKYLSDEYRKKLIPYVIAGPTCDSIDIIQRNVYLPEEIKIGENIISTDIGAYSIMSATKFNGFRLAKVLYLNQNDKLENVHLGIDFDLKKIHTG